ncbi:dihydrolipoyl dehydrogenase [Kytococcus sedentarius]|uniref:Dihydrolipoyl dehydrogenase n=1 Tax=Kytococcus sedentarius (strain ATCC 14392 / DSM 20547 / JCM 11482 / CCUG 33030 / NBRC 15357 / NCTC 11040 / CCM 314 / 541) TaxID=478801 RepID=C7NIL1_KYTSD|nr:dihydrolipoyl dehydrogenase [Kytococcus sedentarius]ACV06649.1 dihydrolipoamide dehydrogenase [Kytococcus sedentarius DSM 20547]QQB64942.1 dihydrolipoyl dehydrogenase [Kytococcus sedentarius]STX14536.1 Dihydrolipoyl dehydrogenase [Kytococcus sedentarius]
MPSSTPTHDLVILGGGSGGYAAALRAAELGLTVALVEKGKLGGTCLHSGCVPTKALLHAAEVADSTRESDTFGVNATFEGIDMGRVNSYKEGIIGRLHKGLQGLVKSRKVEYVEGEGRLTAPNTVTVGDRELVGKDVVLATGSRPKLIPGLEVGGRVMTSEQALQLDTVPESVVVLGGGVIGVEFASVYTSFGAKVTVVEGLDRIVPAEDEAVSKTLNRAFRKRKIDVRTGVRFQSVDNREDGVTVTLEDGTELEADMLLVAIGRGPVTEDMGFEEAGVTLDRGFVTVDEKLRTSVDHVWAVGDIVPGLQLAHRGFAQGIFVAETIAGLDPTPIDESGIPRVTYCDPEIASVGLTEAAAKEKYGEVESVEYNLGGNGKSQILGTQGFVKLVRRTDGPVVGIHMVGARIGEQVGEAQLIYNWEAMPEEVAALIHAHPTQNEALGEAHLALAGKPLHAHN